MSSFSIGDLGSWLTNNYQQLAGIGASALGGQPYKTTETPILNSGQQTVENSLLQGANNLANTDPNLTGYTDNGLQAINTGAKAGATNLSNTLAARGLSNSPVAAAAIGANEENRINQGNSFVNSVPLLANQIQNQNLTTAGNVFKDTPFGRYTQTNQPGGPLGAALAALSGAKFKNGSSGGGGNSGSSSSTISYPNDTGNSNPSTSTSSTIDYGTIDPTTGLPTNATNENITYEGLGYPSNDNLNSLTGGGSDPIGGSGGINWSQIGLDPNNVGGSTDPTLIPGYNDGGGDTSAGGSGGDTSGGF